MALIRPTVYDGQMQRKLLLGDILAGEETIYALSTVGAETLTGPILANTVINRTGSTAAFTDTTDTAANIIASLNSGLGNTGLDVGVSWRFKYKNTTAFAALIAAGTNVTLTGPMTIPALVDKDFLVQVTNGTPTRVYAATTTNASAVITGLTLAQTANLSVGQAVSGTGIAASSNIISVQPGVGVTLNNTATATGTLVALTFAPTVTITALKQAIDLPFSKYVASTAGTSTLAAGDITGALSCTLNSSGGAAITLTTRTADLMIADIPNAQIGMTWEVDVINRNSGTLTMAGGTGVTITGTATLATVTWKKFICTYTAASTITMQVAASALV